MVDAVTVGVWTRLSGAVWSKVGEVPGWLNLEFEARHLQPGTFLMTTAFDFPSRKISKKNIITFDFRGQRFTGLVEHLGPHSDDHGATILEFGGSEALALLGDALCYPDPPSPLGSQPVAQWSYVGNVESVLTKLIADNLITRRGDGIVMGPSFNRGGQTWVHVRFDNLLEQVVLKCQVANLGVRVGLKQATPTSTRATLTCEFYQPVDRSVRVKLSNKVGSLRGWSQSDDVPSTTRVVVGGAGDGTARIFRLVTSAAPESAWGRKRETFVDAGDSSDTADLDQRGLETLGGSATQASYNIDAVDPAGTKYGRHYQVGDLVRVELPSGVSQVEQLSAASVSADSSGVRVTLKPGNPDGANPVTATAAVIRDTRSQVRKVTLKEGPGPASSTPITPTVIDPTGGTTGGTITPGTTTGGTPTPTGGLQFTASSAATAVTRGNVTIGIAGTGTIHALVSPATATTRGTAALILTAANTPSPTGEILGDPTHLASRWVGATTTTGTKLTIETTTTEAVRVKVSTTADLLTAPIFSPSVTPDTQGYSRHTIAGLNPNTTYYYGVEMAGKIVKDGGRFKTFPTGAASFTFGFGSCQNASSSTVWPRLLARNPLLFVHLGDFWYDDGASSTLQSYLDHYDAKLNSANMLDFFRKTPVAYTWSDHDYGMANNAVGSAAGGPNARAAYATRVPYWQKPDANGAIYQTFVVGRVRFIITDNRSNKSSNSATDNSTKTVLGAAQKTWFKNTITAATEPVIIWGNEQPWIGAPATPDDEWFAYSTERAELGNFIKASGKNVAIISGDMHSIAADDGSNSVGNIAVFHAAALNNSASIKGGPYSAGTYGSGTVQQYGTVQITDTGGSTITVKYTGYDTNDTARINLTKTYTV